MRVTCLRNQSGATVIEFALILPPLVLMILGMIEYNLVMYSASVLEGAVGNAARTGRTGYIEAGLSQQEYVHKVVKDRVTGLMDPNQLQIASKSYNAFTAIGDPEPCISPPQTPCPGTPGINFQDINYNGQWDSDQGAAGLGGPNDIVVYTVTYNWPINTPFMSSFIGTNGVYTLSSSAVVKNEPYGTVTYAR